MGDGVQAFGQRHVGAIALLERDAAGHHLVEDDAEGVDIGLLGGDGRRAEQLGRHVFDGAGAVLGAVPLGSLGVELGGDAEIEQDEPGGVRRRADAAAARLQDDVAGLEIAVDELIGMGVGQGIADFRDELAELVDRQPVSLVLEQLFEIVAMEEFHDEVGEAVIVAVVADLDDVVVADFGRELGLLHELAVGEADLDRDGAVELLVDAPVDDAKAAAIDELVEQIPAVELPADQAFEVIDVELAGGHEGGFEFWVRRPEIPGARCSRRRAGADHSSTDCR